MRTSRSFFTALLTGIVFPVLAQQQDPATVGKLEALLYHIDRMYVDLSLIHI